MSEEDGKLVVPAHVASKKVQDDLIVLNLKDGTYYRLNPTAADLWERLRASGSFSGSLEAMAAESDVSRETLQADLQGILEEWKREGLVCSPTTAAGNTEGKAEDQRREAG